MPDRLKESVFSILQRWIEDARVLDLCAGTGAIGIEAMSRGAAWATFVDSSNLAIRTLKQNLHQCGIDSGYDIIARDVLTAVERLAERGDTYDLIFFDPPYASDVYQPTMRRLGEGDLLTADGMVMVMHHAKTPLAESYGKLRRTRQLKQGENLLCFYALD